MSSHVAHPADARTMGRPVFYPRTFEDFVFRNREVTDLPGAARQRKGPLEEVRRDADVVAVARQVPGEVKRAFEVSP